MNDVLDYVGLANDFSFNLPLEPSLSTPELVWIPKVTFSEKLITSRSSFINPPKCSSYTVGASPFFEFSDSPLISQLLEDLPRDSVPVVVTSPIYNVHILPRLN
jgi:hypothetical protein